MKERRLRIGLEITGISCFGMIGLIGLVYHRYMWLEMLCALFLFGIFSIFINTYKEEFIYFRIVKCEMMVMLLLSAFMKVEHFNLWMAQLCNGIVVFVCLWLQIKKIKNENNKNRSF